MTRQEIKILAQRKLKKRVAVYDLLLILIFLINGLSTYILNKAPDSFLSFILDMSNTFLLKPLTMAAIVVYTINLVDKEDKISLREVCVELRGSMLDKTRPKQERYT